MRKVTFLSIVLIALGGLTLVYQSVASSAHQNAIHKKISGLMDLHL